MAEHFDCRCPGCAAMAWLTYRWPGDSPTHTLKITAYGGLGGGTGEPDRHFDPVVRESDYERALSRVGDPFLRAVGYAAREVPPHPRALQGRAVRFAVRRSDREVVRFLEQKWGAHWYPLRAERLRENPDETNFGTLSWLLERVAREMAAQMGYEVPEGRLRAKRPQPEPEPVEFPEAPANRR